MALLHRSRTLAAGAALAGGAGAGLVLLTPGVAAAHSLESSTVSLRVGADSVDATVSVALGALDGAPGTGSTTDVDSYAGAVTAYLDDHLTVTGSDGTAWAETYTSVVRETVEGIESLSVEVSLDPGGADPSALTLTYDAVIEADPAHEAVVVLTDADGDISTAGVLTAADDSVRIGDAAGGSAGTGLADMVGHGLHHVLAGADHLLFLLTLLLVAPLVVSAGRWQRRAGPGSTLRRVLGIVTAFTVGHSLTLLASALGWVAVPGAPVEVLVAVSVGVAGVHAVRPLVRGGEVAIAGGFGLVHGLAFAGILTDLGLDGSASVPALLAFNVGVELAQLVTVGLVLPSLHVVSRTRWYPALRGTGAAVALAAATGWALDRLGLLADPLAGAEEAVVAHPWAVVAGLALLAACCRAGSGPVEGSGTARGPELPGHDRTDVRAAAGGRSPGTSAR